MSLTTLTPSNVLTAIRAALNARNSVKPSNDIKVALKSLSLFPDETARGFIRLCESCGLNIDEQIKLMTTAEKRKGMKNDPEFINVKALDKLMRLSQWIAGVSNEMAIAADKAASKGKYREGVLDNFSALLVNNIFDAYAVRGKFGQLKKTPEFNGHDLKCGISYNWAADRVTLPQDADAERNRYFELGSGDYALGTAGTQGSQMKTLLIAFKLVDVKKAIENDEFKFSVEFAKLIAVVQKTNAVKFDNARK